MRPLYDPCVASETLATINGRDIGSWLAFQIETTDPLNLELVTVAMAGGASSVPAVSSHTGLCLAYAQRSWVEDFVGAASTAPATDEDNLLVALPG